MFVRADGRWRRISAFSCPLPDARRVYQNSLLAGATSGLDVSLRPVADAWESGKLEKTLVPPYDEQAKLDFLNRLVGSWIDSAVGSLG